MRALAGLAAAARSVPRKEKPISLIVPSSVGGGTDTATRLLAAPVEKELDTSVITIDQPGGSMQIGFGFVAGSKAGRPCHRNADHAAGAVAR